MLLEALEQIRNRGVVVQENRVTRDSQDPDAIAVPVSLSPPRTVSKTGSF
jgi:hypothetical protein